ncbi:hypothetical protein GIB67_017764 [Kingdonia uniflora]|uniref:F-box domain-containing protein n=1 Tax=Kingdonia uniflora TaxID=39325 RepID=A0A7J7LQ09_9MAGN|nr:hypothetical protein GIB67_017764 [Kingdonia uniflora]
MSITKVESITSLSSDLFYDILRRLDGATLASASCVCAAFCSISKEERIWENVCRTLWPSTNREDVRDLISSIGGYRKFYGDCFPLIVNKEVPIALWDSSLEYYLEEWAEDDYYGEVEEYESLSPSDFISIVDVRYKDKVIYSKVLWGIPDSDGFNGWFYNCPFRIDLLSYSDRDDNHDEVILSVADGLPAIASIERERKDGKLWKELRDGIRLSWIVVNKKVKQSANVASWIPLGGQRHWPTDKDFLIRFGSILPAKDILPCKVVECIIVMKFRVIQTGEGGVGQTGLKLTELSMQLEDMGGAHVNGRNSLLVLKEALSCCRSKNYSEALESCHLYSKVQNELKEEKMRNESRLDRLCIISGIAAFFTFWYTMKEKMSLTASNRRKRKLDRADPEYPDFGGLVTYKRKRKTVETTTVVPPNTVEQSPNFDTTNEVFLNIVELIKWITLKMVTSVEENCKRNVGGNCEGEGDANNEEVGLINTSLLKSFKFYRTRSIAPGQKVLSEVIAVRAKKKGLTTRSVARGYMLYVLGSFLFPAKKGIDVSARYPDLFAKDKAAKKWSWGSTVMAHMYHNLGAASQDDGRQFACCTTLLVLWIFVHFSKLAGIPTEMDSDQYKYCTCWKWGGFVTDRYDGPTLLKFRETLNKYKVDDTAICPITIDLAADDDVRIFGIHRRKEACANEDGDTPVDQYEYGGEQYHASLNEHTTLSPNAHDTMPIRAKPCGLDQQTKSLNDILQKLKEDKDKESEANIKLTEALKENTSECNLLRENIDQMKEDMQLKRVLDEQCALADLPGQLDVKVRVHEFTRKTNASLEAGLRQKFSLKECNESLSVELNKKSKENKLLKVVNALLIEQIDLQLPPTTPEVWRQSLKKALTSEGMGNIYLQGPYIPEEYLQPNIGYTIHSSR